MLSKKIERPSEVIAHSGLYWSKRIADQVAVMKSSKIDKADGLNTQCVFSTGSDREFDWLNRSVQATNVANQPPICPILDMKPAEVKG